MEIFMRNVDSSVTPSELKIELAKILHSHPYSMWSTRLLNFHIQMFKDRSNLRDHSGLGTLTLPSKDVGQQFLRDYEGPFAPHICTIASRKILFSESNKTPRSDVLESVRTQPYVNPSAAAAQEKRDRHLRSVFIPVSTLQFGWYCRDAVFSIEWEAQFSATPPCVLTFDDQSRALKITMEPYFIVIRYSQIDVVSAHEYLSSRPVIFMTLLSPPTFEASTTPPNRRRLSALPFPDHARLAPYISHAIRLTCSNLRDLQRFRDIGKSVNLRNINAVEYDAQRRDLFSMPIMEQMRAELLHLNWSVAFQIESLLRTLAVDMKEMLSLMPFVKELVKKKGKHHAASVLRYFAPQAKYLFWDDPYTSPETILDCFRRVQEEFGNRSELPPLAPTDTSLFEAYHVEVTPTSINLTGPHLERSNRVLRRYPDHHESFLRVSFTEDGGLQYRFDRDVDGQEFVRARIGPVLHDGLKIAGRNFKFLAYSQSSLKDHSVWFVKPFHDDRHGYVDAPVIISSLGSFEGLEFDRELMFCPARYGARISQAFTATDSSVAVEEVEEIFFLDDIWTSDRKYCFTDGVGTLSKELAREISKELRKKRSRGRYRKDYSRAFQVRFQGSKGMLSVDYTLQGRAICLRHSMIKFAAPDFREIEIAQAFNKPSPYFLNRPLIMLLEGLGVKYEVFKMFQDRAINEVNESTRSLGRAGRMLEAHGLGNSFRLTSVMLNLEKLGLDIIQTQFFSRMLEIAIYHIMRVLKNHARIPIPNAWTLVGVADVHKFLGEGEVFACVKSIDGDVVYLEGPVLISRSPTIHPGDVQIANAIGIPPSGSCFSREPLYNTIVFSVIGQRPLPSFLGGGDLDGDVYNIIPLNVYPGFKLPRTYPPANYEAAERKKLTRPSTMSDVADFVMEYINSDLVGIIATTWLIIADQSSTRGIFDPDCLKLSQLHNVAVDYPKSGNPVALQEIPRNKFLAKPDWNAPETVNPDTERYYQSNRAIGRLFREVKLPTIPKRTEPRKREAHKNRLERDLTDALGHLSIAQDLGDDDLFQTVRDRVFEFFDDGRGIVTISNLMINHIVSIYERYTSELRVICATHTLSYSRSASLMEEEVIIGTIIQKTSQPRQRANMMTKLRERTDILVRAVREELEGHDNDLESYLPRAWIAWEISVREGEKFGAQSFGWLALGAVFDAIKEIEEAEQQESRSKAG